MCVIAPFVFFSHHVNGLEHASPPGGPCVNKPWLKIHKLLLSMNKYVEGKKWYSLHFDWQTKRVRETLWTWLVLMVRSECVRDVLELWDWVGWGWGVYTHTHTHTYMCTQTAVMLWGAWGDVSFPFCCWAGEGVQLQFSVEFIYSFYTATRRQCWKFAAFFFLIPSCGWIKAFSVLLLFSSTFGSNISNIQYRLKHYSKVLSTTNIHFFQYFNIINVFWPILRSSFAETAAFFLY